VNATTTTNGREVRAWSLPVSPSEHDLREIAFAEMRRELRERYARLKERHKEPDRG
jgi:uncharacterized protein VirK/YbjX